MEEFRADFEKRVVQMGEHQVWIGPCYTSGAPYVEVNGRRVLARKVSWVLAGGAAYTRGFRVTCGHPKCVNPDHLQPSESVSRGRGEPYGERLGRGQRMIDGDLGLNHSVDLVQKTVRYRDSFV